VFRLVADKDTGEPVVAVQVDLAVRQGAEFSGETVAVSSTSYIAGTGGCAAGELHAAAGARQMTNVTSLGSTRSPESLRSEG